MQENPQPSLNTARIIAGSLIGGPVLFWIVSWVLVEQRGGSAMPPESPLTPMLARWIWLALAVPCFTGGYAFWRKALTAVERSRGIRDAEAANKALGEIQTWLVIAWSLFEGPALLSGVFFFLLASTDILWSGAALFGAGMFMSFPRREWFEPLERVREREAVMAG